MSDNDRQFKKMVELALLAEWNARQKIEPKALLQVGNRLVPCLIAPAMDSRESKEAMIQAFRFLVRKEGADRMIMVSEGWAAMANEYPDLMDAYKQAGSVESMENKYEVVMLYLWTKSESVLKLFKIDRKSQTPKLIPLTENAQPIGQFRHIDNSIFQNPFTPDPESN